MHKHHHALLALAAATLPLATPSDAGAQAQKPASEQVVVPEVDRREVDRTLARLKGLGYFERVTLQIDEAEGDDGEPIEGWKDIAPYVVVLVMLWVKPNGIFGDTLRKKV